MFVVDNGALAARVPLSPDVIVFGSVAGVVGSLWPPFVDKKVLFPVVIGPVEGPLPDFAAPAASEHVAGS